MKKLIILMLVLGLASVTNAALVLSFNGDTTVEVTTVAPSTYFTIDVYSTDGTDGEFWVYIEGDVSYTGGGTIYSPPAPGTMVASEYFPTLISCLMDPPAVGAPGTWWEIEVHCDGPLDGLITLCDDTGYKTGTLDTLLIHQIPEPMTIALLGLGGLFLRRRK
jgi:hypothetical protein